MKSLLFAAVAICLLCPLASLGFAEDSNNPHFPPSGPAQWLFQGPPAESKFLAVSQ